MAIAAPEGQLVEGYPITGTQDAKGVVTETSAGTDTVRRHVRFGPIHIGPGANVNALALNLPKLGQSGLITRFAYNLEYADGKIPGVDVIHLHHAVWATGNAQFPGGEEKTVFSVSKGFGWPVQAAGDWTLNHMIHNLTATPADVFLTWDVDVIKEGSATAKRTRPAATIFMDVRSPEAYPVFDVLKGAGTQGKFQYPNQAPKAYAGGPIRNRFVVPTDLVLVGAAGHIHPGGLFADLTLTRKGKTVRLFRSSARYWEPAGPISWDMAMTSAPDDWKVQVKKGDVLSVSATYETKRGSWYESMGIMNLSAAEGTDGADPFSGTFDRSGAVTHGSLAENDNHGGKPWGLPDARTLPDGPVFGGKKVVTIGAFRMSQGDLGGGAKSSATRPPVVARGQRLTFLNLDAKADIYHSITSCKAPCNRATGVAYPIADGHRIFDSGELGFGPKLTTAAANVDRWSTPTSLTPGTYTYFCRIHPFMRGSFRVKG